jgi:hypothetical protein
MFAKNKVSQSMIDAVNTIISETKEEETLGEAIAPIKEPTKTGMKVFGRSYGNSAKAKQDQTKSSVDDLKGPKSKDMKEAAKPDFLDMDKDGNKKESMKKAITDKSVKEELKGDQHKIDKNKNKKIDSHDFAILRGEKKVKEEMTFKDKLIESIRRSDIPAYLRKARGDAPLTPAEVKGPSKDAISHSQNLAKARNEEVEEIEEVKKPTGELKDACWKGYTAVGMKKKGGRQVPNCVPEEVEHIEEDIDAPLTTDTLAGRMPGGKANSFKSYKVRMKPLDKEEQDMKTPELDVPELSAGEKTIKAEATIAGLSGWKKVKKDVEDKSGAVHTPMSRARDLAQKAFKKVQDKTKIKD